MRKLTVQGTVYNIPDSGEDVGTWGDETSDFLEAVSDTLALLVGANDILQTSFVIDNYETTGADVRGLFFNPSQVRAANVSYSIYRQTDDESLVETGDMLLSYDANAAPTEKWKLAQRVTGDAGVYFTIDDNGQVHYQSSQMTGANYTGIMKFTAKTLST